MRQVFACRKFFSQGEILLLCGRKHKLKRKDSLKRKKEFRYTYRVGKKQSSRLCTLVFAKSRAKNSRIGFSVSKKIGNSVTRNRVKRRMREAVTPLISAIRPGFNLVFVAREDIIEASFDDICSAVRTLLIRADLYTE